MIEIRPIQPDEWETAKQIVYLISHVLFKDPRPLEESIAYRESQGALQDMDDIQKYYFDKDGVFLVMTDDNRIIGMGAIRRLEDNICELRRLWLLIEYHGKGLGYRLMMELLRYAREMGYEKMRLETAPRFLTRATAFYRRLGFYEIPAYEIIHPNDIAMEMIL
jgi:putative acetyltransferase